MQHAANVQSFDFIGDKLQHTPGPHLIGGSLTADIKQNASDSPGTILWLKRHLPGLSHARTRATGTCGWAEKFLGLDLESSVFGSRSLAI
jgi:hypothetical protein